MPASDALHYPGLEVALDEPEHPSVGDLSPDPLHERPERNRIEATQLLSATKGQLPLRSGLPPDCWSALVGALEAQGVLRASAVGLLENRRAWIWSLPA